MVVEDAYYTLFKKDFGSGALFKNQGDLAINLINNQRSKYYTPKSDNKYNKRLGNLKVYISQLFSETTRRSITQEFKESLWVLIVDKISMNEAEKEQLFSLIIDDLIKRNTQGAPELNKDKEITSFYIEFFLQLSNADYVSVFSTREIKFQKKTSFADLLLDGLIKSLREGSHNKWYRFNFPVEQTCYLFWLGLRKEVIKYLHINKNYLPSAISQLHSNAIISFNSVNDFEGYPNIESRVASEILTYLSKHRIICVFAINAPIFLMPFVAINPNDRSTRSVYSIYQSDNGEDQIHKFTTDEMFYWSFFVWDNLRSNEFGRQIEYSDSYTG